MKRLLVFFDGTWNTADGRDAITNVVKLHRAVLPEDAAGVRQMARYVVGIATEDSYGRWKFAVGAAGVGVAERIQEGYEFLVENYEPGDEIFLFGFSRGAFQARSLGGMIALCGILRGEHKARGGEAWAAYQGAKSKSGQAKIREVRALAHHPVRIRCIGVWDTVGNLGIPLAPRIFDSPRAVVPLDPSCPRSSTSVFTRFRSMSRVVRSARRSGPDGAASPCPRDR